MRFFRKFIDTLLGNKDKEVDGAQILDKTDKNDWDVPESLSDRQIPRLESEKISLNLETSIIISKEFYVIDTETTGLERFKDRIVELALIKYKNGKIEDTFHSLIKPGFPMPEKASSINNITDNMLLHAPDEAEVIKSAREFLRPVLEGKVILCGHNADFHVSFFINALRRHKYPCDIKFIDTLSESRRYISVPYNYKLSSLSNYLGIEHLAPHRANSDAQACGELMLFINKDFIKKEPINSSDDDLFYTF